MTQDPGLVPKDKSPPLRHLSEGPSLSRGVKKKNVDDEFIEFELYKRISGK